MRHGVAAETIALHKMFMKATFGMKSLPLTAPLESQLAV